MNQLVDKTFTVITQDNKHLFGCRQALLQNAGTSTIMINGKFSIFPKAMISIGLDELILYKNELSFTFVNQLAQNNIDQLEIWEQNVNDSNLC